MKSKYLITLLMLVGVSLGGCGFFRYQIIPQSSKGPHGGAMVLIDERVSRYVEFVATPQSNEWLFQLYSYNSKMKSREFVSYARAEITNGSDEKKTVNLYNIRHWFFPWSPAGHLEGRVSFESSSKFKVKITLLHNRRDVSPDELYFEYPY